MRTTGPPRSTPLTPTPHNEARDQIWDELVTILLDKHDPEDDVDADVLRDSLVHDEELHTLDRAWPPSRRPTSSVTCGQCRPTADVHPGSAPRTSRRCGARTPRRGQCPTCRSWTPHGRGSATPSITTSASAGGRRRRRARAGGRGHRRPHRRGRRLRGRGDDAASPGHPGEPRRRRCRAPDRPRPARRSFRAHRRGRGPRADRRRVADAAAPLPFPSLTIVGDRAQARHGFTERGRSGSSGSDSTGSPCPP